LQSSSGNILDDETLIHALDQSKQASIAVKARLEATAMSSAEIQRARSAYSSVPDRAVAIFYAAQALSVVNPVYALSLSLFRSQLVKSLHTAAHPDENSPQVRSYLLSLIVPALIIVKLQLSTN
jgi:dynein heavy chain, axonemal